MRGPACWPPLGSSPRRTRTAASCLAGAAQAMGCVPKTGFRPEGRHHDAAAGGHHAHTNHVALDGHQRVVGQHPDVAAVLHAHRTHAVFLGFVHGDLHGARPHLQADAAVRIEGRAHRRLADGFHVRRGIQDAGRVHFQIAAHHVGDAVALAAAQIAHDQHVRAERGIFGRHAHLLEQRLRAFAGSGLGDKHLIRLRHEEVFQHGWLRSVGHERNPPYAALSSAAHGYQIGGCRGMEMGSVRLSARTQAWRGYGRRSGSG